MQKSCKHGYTKQHKLFLCFAEYSKRDGQVVFFLLGWVGYLNFFFWGVGGGGGEAA